MTLKIPWQKNFTTRITLLTMALIFVNVPTVFAQAFSQDDLNSIVGQTPFFDPNASSNQNQCDGGTATATGPTATATGSATWSSGAQPPYYLEEYAINVLEDLAQATGKPQTDTVTYEHVLALVAWFWAEGGDIENTDLFNPLNTSEKVPGATTQSTGNEAYTSFDSGVEATVLTMTGSYQSRIGGALTDESTTAQQVMQAITYYQNYKGNAAWAEADVANQAGYYKGLIANVNQARSNYNKEASTEMGTSVYEEAKNLRVPVSKLVYGNQATAPSTGTTTADTTNPVSNCATVSASSSSYKNPLRDIKNLGQSRVDQGVDYTGSGPVYAIGNGKVLNLTNSGWPGGTFIVYQLLDGPASGKYVYFAENCPNIQVHIGDTVNSSTVLCTLVNADPWSETGWANGTALGEALAHDVWIGNDSNSYYTAYGLNFSQFMQSLGAPPGIVYKGGKELGSLPSGWPTWQ